MFTVEELYKSGRSMTARTLIKWRKVLNAKRQRIAELETRNAALMLNEYEGERMASQLARDFDEMTKRIAQLEAANAELRQAADEEAQFTDVQKYLSQTDEDASVYESDRSRAAMFERKAV